MSQDSALSFSAIKRMANKRTLNTNRTQSIKFEIELPINMDGASDYEYTSDYDTDRQNDERTICFKIKMNQCTPRVSQRTERPVSISSGIASSGYSSSVSSASSIQGLDQFETSNKTFFQSNQKNALFCTENVYDRLNYNTSKRRSSLASMTSSSESSNQTSECDIYEEIGNFSQIEAAKPLFATPKPTKPHFYCNEKMETAPQKTPKSSIYKRREYTVNEIFQNAKSFQDEATKQEINIHTKNNTVNSLKKIFESNLSKVKTSKKAQPAHHNNQTHDYVNEKISAPIFV